MVNNVGNHMHEHFRNNLGGQLLSSMLLLTQDTHGLFQWIAPFLTQFTECNQ